MTLLKSLIIALLAACAGSVASAQTRVPPARRTLTQSPSRKPETRPVLLPEADTPAVAPVVRTAVPADSITGRNDSTVIEKVADAAVDSVRAQLKAPIRQRPVTLKSLVIPGVLFAYGAVTLNTSRLREINEEVNEATALTSQTFKRPYLEDYLLFAPAATVYGLNLFGVKGRNNLIDRSVIYGMSNLIANGIVYGVKRIGIETRPDSSDRYSFPSGHTAEAFVSAEFLRQEYRQRVPWTVIAAGYAAAAGVGYLRMYHNKHWLSDVVAGAGIGIASTRFSYYLYPAIKHFLFGSRKIKSNAMVLPTYSPGGFYGVAIVRQL